MVGLQRWILWQKIAARCCLPAARHLGRLYLGICLFAVGMAHAQPLQAQMRTLGPNVLQNGTLKTGTEHWVTALSGGTAHATLEFDRDLPPDATGKVARFIVTAVDNENWHIQLQQEGLDLAEGQSYTLSFWAKADRERPLSVNASVDKDDFHWIGLNNHINIDTDWHKYTVVFTTAGTLKNHNRFAFLLGDALGTVELTNIALQQGTMAKPFGPNLLQNGDFTRGGLGWSPLSVVAPAKATTQLPSAVSPPHVAGKAGQISVTAMGKQNWYVQFFQNGLDLSEAEPHTLTFWARADHARPLAITVGEDKEDFHSVGLDAVVTLSAEWRKYSCIFTANRTVKNSSRLVFLVGDALGTVDIADLSLRQGIAGIPPPRFSSDALTLKSHPLLGNWQSYHRNATLTSEEYQKFSFTFRPDGTGTLVVLTLNSRDDTKPKARTSEEFHWAIAEGEAKIAIGSKTYSWNLADADGKEKLTLKSDEKVYILFRH